MKLLIFFLIFFLLFTPHVNAEEEKTTFSINVQVLDLSGRPIPGLRFALIDHNGNERGSGITTSGKDGNIPGTVESFGTTQNKNDETMNGYTLEMIIFYYHGPVADRPENRGRSLEIIGSSKRCFENTTKGYTIYVNELNEEPAAVVMYNMINTSLNLAKQSEETANESYNLSLHAFWLAVISLIYPVINLLKLLQKLFKKQLKYNDADYMFFNPQNKITSGQLTFFFWLGASVCIIIRTYQPDDYTWITDILIGAFITAGFITVRIDIEK